MNASEAYEKYKHFDKSLTECHLDESLAIRALKDLWSAVKHEAFDKVAVVELKINGKVVYPEQRTEEQHNSIGVGAPCGRRPRTPSGLPQDRILERDRANE